MNLSRITDKSVNQWSLTPLISICVGAVLLFILIGCSGEFVYRKDIERLSKPGALDVRLTGIYDIYKFKFLDKYYISHQWPRNSDGCSYMGLSTVNPADAMVNGDVYAIKDIFEANDSTWQRSYSPKDVNQLHPYNFDRFVRAEYTVKTKSGLKIEKGYNTLCYQSWWTTSHSIALFLRKQPLDDMKAGFTQWYPEGTWTTKTVNNLTWYVQEVPEDKFRTRPLNGVAGPFQLWALPLADTGYSMAIKLGASKESLQYPDAHARMQAMFRHLIESVKIEPLQTDSPSISSATTESDRPAPQVNPTTLGTKQVLPKDNGSTGIPMQEYPDKTLQLQQNMQKDSNRDIKNLLRNTAPKAGR